MKPLDILFLGRLLPKDREQEIKSKMKTGMVDAANALQWNLIDGIYGNGQKNITVLNYLPVDSYPNGYKDCYMYRNVSSCENGDISVIDVGHLNLTVIKQFTNIIPYKKELQKWIARKTSAKKIIFLYSAQPLSLKLAKYAKLKDSTIETVCTIADIPEFNTISDLHGIKKWYNDYEVSCTQKLYASIDKFVLLTKQMHEKLNLSAPYMVMEGIAPEENVEIDETLSQKYQDDKYVLYTGTLNYKFGIGTLLEAFRQMKDTDLKLIICGFGEAEKAIVESQDKRIVYLGKVDRRQALALQRGATVLVNPRQNNEEFTKYSFPSKTMEYLASGTPVVAYKLDGIPDEYDSFIHYVPNNTPEALADAIHSILALSREEQVAIGKKAKEFVTLKKNKIEQTKQILKFIENE